MTEWTTLSVKERTRDRFNDAKDDMDAADPGVPDMSADLFINTLLDTLEQHQTECAQDPLDQPELGDVIEAIEQEFDHANQTLDGDVSLREILGRLDDLEAELPRKVAEEVHSR